MAGRGSPAIVAFNAGEFSPQMEGRVDQEHYTLGAHIQQNFIPLKQGPSMRRPGTACVQPVKNSANRSWLKRFEFSQTQAYVLEFGHQYVRFYTLHGPVITTAAAYNGGTSYVIGNLVLQAGTVYYCTAPTTGNTPPNPAFWAALSPYAPPPTYQPVPNYGIYEIPSPYTAADLTDAVGEFALQIEQQGDVLYIAGGYAGTSQANPGSSGIGYAPMTLTRYANNPPLWTMAAYSPNDGPFSDPVPLVPGQNTALYASAVKGTVTISAVGGTPFAATDVGRLVRLQSQTFNVPVWTGNKAYSTGNQVSQNGQNYIALNTATSGVNPPVHTSGTVQDGVGGVYWQWTDSGYGIARITAYVSGSQVTAQVLLNFPANVVGVPENITAITQANPAVVSLVANPFVLGAPVFIAGVAGMTQINGNMYYPTVVSGTLTLGGVDSSAYGTYTGGGQAIENATLEWQLGAWSNTTEWPRALAFFKDRLFWLGKLNYWGSVPGLYTSHAPDSFGQQTTASAINNLISGSDASSGCWMSAAIILLIGTEGGEYGVDAAQYSASPLGPANVECLRQSGWRSRHIRPELIGPTLYYVQRSGRRVFAADYSLWLNRYDSTDQSKFSYHLTTSGITATAYMQEPNSILWATRADGTLLSFTVNREDQVAAWVRHNLGGGGKVESIATIPDPTGQRDELWLIVNRTIGGQTVRTVEYMAKPFEGPEPATRLGNGGSAGDPQSSAWYVDCGLQYSGAPTNQVSGLQYLAGETVAIFADGGVQPQQVVPPSGVLNLQSSFSTVTVGLPYQSNLVPMRFEGGAEVGTAQGKIKQGVNLVLRLVDTLGGQYGQLIDDLSKLVLDDIFQNLTTTPLDAPPPIFSGDIPLSFTSNPISDQDARDYYVLAQWSDPVPATVVGIFPNYNVQEPGS